MTFQKGHPFYGTPESIRRGAEKRKGLKLSEFHRMRVSQAQLGREHKPNEGFQRGCTPHPDTHATRFKKGQVPHNLGKKHICGEKHWNWQGGKTKQSDRIKNSLEYKLWRKAVFERDGYKCLWCGDASGGNLEADHILPQFKFPHLRFDVVNGRTLCSSCHKKTDTFGSRARTFRISS